MNLKKANRRRCWTKLALALFCAAGVPAIAVAGDTTASPPTRDGSHDFEFDIGVWHTQIRRLVNPFSDDRQTIELKGTIAVRKVWGGRASLEEIEVDGPKGHWEGMNLFLYNPETHQWSQSYSNAASGTIGAPFIGEFKNGRAELIAPDTFDNRAVLVRAVWSNIQPNSHDYAEDYSDDGGRTWRPSFSAHLTRAAS